MTAAADVPEGKKEDRGKTVGQAMEHKKKIENVYIIGMGALGMLFGGLIEDRIGSGHAAFLMDDERYERNCGTVPTVNGVPRPFRMVRASEAEPADLIMIAAKATGLADALVSMERAVGEETIIISILNGITSEEIVSERYGEEKVIHTVAQGMDAVCFDNALTYVRPGRLCVGIPPEKAARINGMREKLDSLTEFFDRTGIPYQVEDDIIRRQWSKFMLNCGCNQVCMVWDTGYGGMMEPASEAFMAMTAAMREVVVLARLEGVDLGEEDVAEYLALMRTLQPDAMPSMEQDRIRKKKTEVEIFAGTVRRLAAKHGIEVPAADFLYRRIREIETTYEK